MFDTGQWFFYIQFSSEFRPFPLPVITNLPHLNINFFPNKFLSNSSPKKTPKNCLPSNNTLKSKREEHWKLSKIQYMYTKDGNKSIKLLYSLSIYIYIYSNAYIAFPIWPTLQWFFSNSKATGPFLKTQKNQCWYIYMCILHDYGYLIYCVLRSSACSFKENAY